MRKVCLTDVVRRVRLESNRHKPYMEILPHYQKAQNSHSIPAESTPSERRATNYSPHATRRLLLNASVVSGVSDIGLLQRS